MHHWPGNGSPIPKGGGGGARRGGDTNGSIGAISIIPNQPLFATTTKHHCHGRGIDRKQRRNRRENTALAFGISTLILWVLNISLHAKLIEYMNEEKDKMVDNINNHKISASVSPKQPTNIPHPVAHLNCEDHGGPKNKQIIDEMVYWSDIPSDAAYLSPMHPLNDPNTPDDTERYLTFEPDHRGWNNDRMVMETALVMSHAMGRTLVLPHMLLKDRSDANERLNEFDFNDFFHLNAISMEHKGFKVITMEEFLTRVAMKGELHGIYPSANQTNCTGNATELWDYLRDVGYTPEWHPWKCALAIPASTDPQSVVELNATLQSIMDGSYGKPKPTLEEFNGHPTPVNASMAERMREMLADRSHLCIYDNKLQETKLIHLKITDEVRLLTHFYGM